jgi:hypothetical protein
MEHLPSTGKTLDSMLSTKQKQTNKQEYPPDLFTHSHQITTHAFIFCSFGLEKLFESILLQRSIDGCWPFER